MPTSYHKEATPDVTVDNDALGWRCYESGNVLLSLRNDGSACLAAFDVGGPVPPGCLLPDLHALTAILQLDEVQAWLKEHKHV